MKEEKNARKLVPEFMQIIFRSRQTLSQLYQLTDSPIMELYIMLLIDKQDDDNKVFAVDIQNKLCASKAAVSNMLSSLEKKGFLNREINLDNRRKISLSLTDSGKSELKKCSKPFNDLMVEILERFGYDNTVSLIKLMDKLSEVLDNIYSEKV